MALLKGGGNVFRVQIVEPVHTISAPKETATPPLYEEIPSYNESGIYESISSNISNCSSLALSSASTVTKFTEEFCNTATATALSCFTALLPLFAVVLGLTSIKNCPAEPRIPQFLIFGGVLGLVKFIVHIIHGVLIYRRKKRENNYRKYTVFYFIDGILILLFISIAIAGVFLVFGLNPNFVDTADLKYCDKLAYHFAFALLAVFFVASIFAILTGFISVLVLCSVDKK